MLNFAKYSKWWYKKGKLAPFFSFDNQKVKQSFKLNIINRKKQSAFNLKVNEITLVKPQTSIDENYFKTVIKREKSKSYL